MNNKVLTISIAAYNVEKYIRNTLNSLLAFEVLDDIEVIIVDDGGTDNSLKIAKEYELKYPNTFKVIHKENGGYGSTVNYSVAIASGKYFRLLDGDDWYDKNEFVKFVNKLKTIDTDMVVTNFKKNYSDKEIDGLSSKYFTTDREIQIENINVNEGIPMHAITYKTSIIRSSGLKLKEHLLYTDNYYVAIPLTHVNTVAFYNYYVYHYRLGQIGQSVDINVQLKNINQNEIITYDLLDFYSKLNLDKVRARVYLCRRIASSCSDHFAIAIKRAISKETLKYIIDFDKKIKNYSFEVYNTMATLDRNASRVIRIVRASNYILYWPLALIYKMF